MRRVSFILSFLFAIAIIAALTPPRASAAQQDRSWRNRASIQQDIVEDDVAVEISFGREVAARIIGHYELLNNEALTKYVNLVGASVAANSNRPELTFHFGVLDTNDINAYAAPGGYVFVTKGALSQMNDEAELAAVLAHEITHVAERHAVNELGIKAEDSSGAAGMARFLGGGGEAARTAFAQAVDAAVDILFKNGYKREDEIQADHGAVLLTTMAGYDPSAFIRYFERIGAGKKDQTAILDKTHPSFESRIEVLKTTIESEGIQTGDLKTNKARFDAAISKLK